MQLVKATALAVVATVAVLGWTAPASAQPGPDVPIDTPMPDEVFNGYVLGTFRDGAIASPQEIVDGVFAYDTFYDEPPLRGDEAPGTLLKAKPFDVLFTGVKPGNVSAWKVMYVTENLDGTRDISTGVVMIPEDGRDNATRSVVAYQEANDSVGPRCHPSTQWSGGALGEASAWSALGPLALMFGEGLAVVISDVGNDADPAPHGVFAGKYAAKALLNGVRAAFALEDAGLNPDAPLGIFGIAGGGVGGAFAAELQPEYAPELNLKATVLEGMVVDQRNFIRFAGGSLASGFVFATLLGLEPQYPEMRIDEKLNPAGKAMADLWRTQCQVTYFLTPFLPINALFTSGENPADIAEFQHVYEDNKLGVGGAPDSKVLITSCAADDSFMSVVPAQDSRDLADRYRAKGTEVVYHPTDCNMGLFFTNLYRWGTDLFGMQTVDWLANELS
ncbi:lipase family protein [Rhodococcus sp. CC-R104]|uniref:Lipase family protein n=1 Tax=Rhodococcus chondri TaxID=3065941 RepID=A0ABU7JTP3_9NOCA|nr:lipase family protein [Rhodococcus sp. CC-R104]MEE2033393.1 lipase family protein [Rhodococcus sp. CC-R104]